MSTYLPSIIIHPTLLADASRLGLSVVTGTGVANVPGNDLSPVAPAFDDEEPTGRIYTPLPPPPPVSEERRALPTEVARQLKAHVVVSDEEVLRLESWMSQRGLIANFMTSAAEYLVQMQKEARLARAPRGYYIGSDPADDLSIQGPDLRPQHLSAHPDARDRFWIRNRYPDTKAFLTRGEDTWHVPTDPHNRMMLRTGDVISIGSTHLEFRVAGKRPRFVPARPPQVFDQDEPTLVDIRLPARNTA